MSFSNNLSDIIIHGGFPLPLRWAGWSTTTHLLKGNGWEILAHEDRDMVTDSLRVSIAATSPQKDTMLSGHMGVPYPALMGAQFSGQNTGLSILSYLASAGIEMRIYKSRDTFHTVSAFDVTAWNAMRPVDLYATTTSSRSFSELKCFHYKDEGPSIYIPPSSENELLDMLLKVQYPNQQEIKKKLVLPETKPIIRAQVFSLAV